MLTSPDNSFMERDFECSHETRFFVNGNTCWIFQKMRNFRFVALRKNTQHMNMHSGRIIKVISILISAVERLINSATCEFAEKTKQWRRERGRKWSGEGVFGSHKVPRHWTSGIRARNVLNIRPLTANILGIGCRANCVRTRLHYSLFQKSARLTFADNSKAWNFLRVFCGAFKILNGILRNASFRSNFSGWGNITTISRCFLWMNFFKFMNAWDKARRWQRRERERPGSGAQWSS